MSFQIIRLSLCALLLAYCGCNSNSGNMGTVEGVVTLDGKPLDQVTIAFYPTNGRGSLGFTDADGRYSLVYTSSKDGALIGPHKVTISTATEGPDQYSSPGAPEARKETMPARYLDKKTTDLTANVESGKNTIDFNLKSADF